MAALIERSEAVRGLVFLDQHPGEWYCTNCWARAVGVDPTALHRFSVIMATTQALIAPYQARPRGSCRVCDTAGARPAGLKGTRSIQSLGKLAGV